MENQINEFVIKNPKWAYYIALCLLILELSGTIVITVLFCIEIIDFLVFFPFIFMIAFFFLFTVFILYGCHKEEFTYKDGTLTYVKIIKKRQSVKIEDLAYVTITYNLGILMHVKLYDKQGKIAISFLDDGTFMKNGLFMALMAQKNIPVREIC